MKAIIVDIDGVLADFTKGYRRLAHKMFGKPEFGTLTRPHEEWNDPDISQEEDRAIWEFIEDPGNTFWERLDSLATSDDWYRLNEMARASHYLYFVTNRRAANAKQQSEHWLRNHAITNPTVILAKNKGAFAKHLGAVYAIDDMWQNIWDMSHHCWSYALTRPHNKNYEWPYRVNTVSEWLDIVEKEKIPDIQRVSTEAA